jgi:putative ABC transport system permease protein
MVIWLRIGRLLMRIDTRVLKALRDLWQFRGRSIWVVLAMTLSLCASFALWHANYWVQSATRQQFLASLPVSASLSMDVLPQNWRRALAAVPGVAAARAQRVLRASIQGDGARLPALLFVLEDFQTRDLGQLHRVDGVWPPAPDSWVIERSALAFSGLTLGDDCALQLDGSAQSVALKLSGVAKDVSLAPGWMEHVVYGFIDSETAQRLGAPAGFDALQLRVQDRTHSRDQVRVLALQMRQALKQLGAQVGKIEVPEPLTHEHARQMDSLMLVQRVFALFALLFSSFLTANLMSAVLAQQLRDIAIMKALGAEFSRLATITLAQAAALGLLAGLLAIPSAYWLGLRYGEIRVAMLNFDLQGLAPPIAVLLQQTALAVLLPVLAAALPVWRGLRASTQAALCDTGFAHTPTAARSQDRATHSGFAGAAIAWLRGNRPLALAIDNALRRRTRLWLTLIAIASGGAVFLAAHNLRVAVQASVAQMFSAVQYDATLQLVQPQQAAQLTPILRGIKDVAEAQLWGGGRVDWLASPASATQADDQGDALILASISLIALPPNSTLFQPQPIDGVWFAADAKRELLISRSLAKTEPAWRIGAHLPLSINGKLARWRVVGIVDSGPQPLLYASAAAWQAASGATSAQRLVLRLAGKPNSNADVTEAMAGQWQIDALLRIREALTQAGIAVDSSQRVAQTRRISEDHLLMVVNFLAMMGILMLAIGGMGLASTLGLSVLERRHEIALMRALGASDRTLYTLVLWEAMLLALLAFLLALPISVPMSLGLGRAFSAIMFEVPNRYLPHLSASLLWLVFSLGLALLAAILPARSARRIGGHCR